MNEMLTRARRYARQKHRGQLDKCDLPYFNHPWRVSHEALLRAGSQRAAILGILHDTVEDTDATLEDIAVQFGGDIAKGIDALTRRTNESYKDYIRRIARTKDRDVVSVKLADLQDNSDPHRNACIKDPREREAMAKMVRGRYTWATTYLMGTGIAW